MGTEPADDAAPNAVAAVIRRRDGRYLLIRRAEGIPAAGYWTPITGRPESGEPFRETVVREVHEEVGLAVTCGDEIFRSTTQDGHWRLVWFEAHLIDESSAKRPLQLLAAEVAEARWVRLHEIQTIQPMFPITRRFLLELNERSGGENR